MGVANHVQATDAEGVPVEAEVVEVFEEVFEALVAPLSEMLEEPFGAVEEGARNRDVL